MKTSLENQPSQRTHKILVVEDEPIIRQIYAQILIRSGYEVDTAVDGEAAWNVLQGASLGAGGYDLLITDNNMPRLSGMELIAKLRSAQMTLPIIMASGSAPTNTEDLQLAAILPKPIPMTEFVKTVNAVLRPTREPEGVAGSKIGKLRRLETPLKTEKTKIKSIYEQTRNQRRLENSQRQTQTEMGEAH